jgi:hypothetical protein
MTTGRIRLAAAASAIALSLAMPLLASAEPRSRIAATVVDFHGKYGLVVRDAGGALAEVTLRQGTIIKPLGLRLERGMIVAIVGQAGDRSFAAAEVYAPFEPPPYARRPTAYQPRFDSPGDRPGAVQGGDRWTEYPGSTATAPRESTNPH